MHGATCMVTVKRERKGLNPAETRRESVSALPVTLTLASPTSWAPKIVASSFALALIISNQLQLTRLWLELGQSISSLLP
jgi:hypothetical protein